MNKNWIISIIGIGIMILVIYQINARTNNLKNLDGEPGMSMLQSPGKDLKEIPETDYNLGDGHIDNLKQFPEVKAGDETPFDLWNYGGKGKTSFTMPELPMPWENWVSMNESRKEGFMKKVDAYMADRYNFNGAEIEGVMQSGLRKPVMKGPIAILPNGVSSYEDFNKMTADEIKQKDVFPYKPLAHPIHSTAHMVFPDEWNEVHPEHNRMDMDHDFPDEYLPEFPAPLFLTTHKELGDVSNGKEITITNYWELFNGLLTPEQMEGLKELLRPSPTTWFNQTTHRITKAPSAGVACFSCHVNGHTNAAFELAPDARPNLARLRVETPTMRGNYNLQLLASKRSVRSMDHFAEIEEYFDGDPMMQQAIGPRAHQKKVANRMGDFNSIIDFPPAPKLGPLGKLLKEKANEQELRGESLFWGKAMCSQCHSGPAFVDDYMHDLQVERFYHGRPEGPIKTFALRGIKDSPPYLHDGRCPTLHDAVEFFNIILELDLNTKEKEDLVAYLLCL